MDHTKIDQLHRSRFSSRRAFRTWSRVCRGPSVCWQINFLCNLIAPFSVSLIVVAVYPTINKGIHEEQKNYGSAYCTSILAFATCSCFPVCHRHTSRLAPSRHGLPLCKGGMPRNNSATRIGRVDDRL